MYSTTGSSMKDPQNESVDPYHRTSVASSSQKSSIAFPEHTTHKNDRPDHISKARSYEEYKEMLADMSPKEQQEYLKSVRKKRKEREVDITPMDPWEVMAKASISRERTSKDGEGR